MNKRHYFVILFLWVFWSSSAQTFKSTKMIRGFDLTSETIFSINQDKNGFIWLATSRGVKYSDGIAMMQLPEHVGVHFSDKQLIHTDVDGHIWIYQTKGRPVVFYHDLTSWRRIPLSLEEGAESLKLSNIQLHVTGTGPDKMLYLVAGNEIIVQDMKGKLVKKFPVDPMAKGQFISFFMSAEDHVHFIYEKSIFAFRNNALQELSVSSLNLSSELLNVVFNKEENTYYYLVNDSLYRSDTLWDIGSPIFAGFSRKFITGQEAHGLFEVNGDIYFFYNSQLYKRNIKSQTIIEISADDENDVKYIECSFVDREGIIWLGSYRGASILSSLRFQNFDERIGLPALDISAIEYLKPSVYIIGYNNGYQVWKDDSPLKTVAFSDPENPIYSRILNFSTDKYGRIWFSAYKIGLGYIDPYDFEWHKVSVPNDGAVNYVDAKGDSLLVVTHGKIWKAAIDQHGSTMSFVPFLKSGTDKDDLWRNYIRKIGQVQDKWIILDNGEHSAIEDPYVGDNYIRITGYDYFYKDDTLLLATEKGLFFLENAELKPYSIQGYAIESPVYVVLADEQHRLWLGTNFGVFLVEDGHLRQFNERNGLIGNEINRGAMRFADYGRVFIGTQNGVSVYIPEEDRQHTIRPITYIEKLTVASDSNATASATKIPYSNNNVSVEYRAVTFSPWPYLQVFYKLEGFHNEWQVIQNPRENKLYFNNLPPGEYQLMIKASLGKQAESDEVYAAPFSVAYPYYLQGWFVALVVIVFVGLGILLNFLFVQFKYQGILKSDLDRKKVEIKKTEDQFKNVWNSSVDGLMLSIMGGKVIAANPALCRMAGVTEEELLTNGLPFLFKDPNFYTTQRRIIVSQIEQVNSDGITQELQMPFRTGDREIELFLTKLNSEYDGSPFLLSVFRDISQKKAYEEGLKNAKERAEEVSMLKSSILSNMSHEIRTPLNGILGSAENILRNISNQPHLASQVRIIQESGERLLHTINTILDFSKIQSDKRNINYVETNINDFFSKILVQHKSAAIKKGLLLTVKYRTKPFVGMIEREYLTMIVDHVVSNAVKYSVEGIIALQIEKKGGKLQLQVKDQGIGISEEYIDKLFFPFEQESNGYDRKFEGVGLGLTVTKHLLDELSGTISIKSKKGVGTEVVIEVPLNE